MSIGITQALGAYHRTLARPATAAPDAGVEAPGFGRLVENMVADTGAALRNSEAASLRAIAGKSSLVDVVTSVTAAETQLETLIAVRDRVVSAYQDVMRMTI